MFAVFFNEFFLLQTSSNVHHRRQDGPVEHAEGIVPRQRISDRSPSRFAVPQGRAPRGHHLHIRRLQRGKIRGARIHLERLPGEARHR